MSKNTLMVLALLVTLLTGWLVLSLAQKSEASAAQQTAGTTTSSDVVGQPYSDGDMDGSDPTKTEVDITSGTATKVQVK